MSLIYVGGSNVFLHKNADVVAVTDIKNVPPNEDEGRRHVRAALAQAAEPSAKHQEALRRAQELMAHNEAAVVACAALKDLAGLPRKRFAFG